MQTFFEHAALQHHPLRALEEFLANEEANEKGKKYDSLRFVGYVMDIGFDTVTIITADKFKVLVGGIPRNSLLIMVPSGRVDGAPPHFTLLRVLEVTATPLSRETQQTYFELQKKSMPELDVFTQNELQWGALKTGVLGMFYPHPQDPDTIEFSGDVNNFVSAHKYKVYAPDSRLLNLVINSLVSEQDRFSIGHLRLTECRLTMPGAIRADVDVFVSTRDFLGSRTAMFYEHPDASIAVLGSLIKEAGRDTSNYIKAFLSVDLPSVADVQGMPKWEVTRPRRKILMYWAILRKAGFAVEEDKLKPLISG